MNFEVTKPTADPFNALVGEQVTISISITPAVSGYATVRTAIYEGDFWGGFGPWIASYDQSHYFAVGVKKVIQVKHIASEGSDERRDVRVVIYDDWGTSFDSGDKSEWDDVYYVKEAGPAQTLEIDIEPPLGGHVRISPASIEGLVLMQDNDTVTYPDGAIVEVTAYPVPGYEFEKWTDEIEGGTSFNNPDYVKPMTEHRAVKAYFVEVEGEEPPDEDEDLTFSGEITQAILKPGEVDKFLITFAARAENWWDGAAGWFTRVTLRALPYEDSDEQGPHYGATVARQQELRLQYLTPGVYPAQATLEAMGRTGVWQHLDTVSFNIIVPGEEPPPEDEEDEEPSEGGSPWLPIVLILGGGAAIYASTKKKK